MEEQNRPPVELNPPFIENGEVEKKNQQNSETKNSYMKEYRMQYKQRVKRLTVTLSQEEFFQLEQSAREHGKGEKLSAFLKEAGFAYLKQEYLVPKYLEDKLQELVLILRNMGNNFNQITRYTHKLRRATLVNLSRVEKILTKVEALIVDFVCNPKKK